MRWYLLLFVALMCALGATLPSATVEARVVSLSRVERAWKMACPHLNTKKAQLWAGIVQKEARQRQFCPYTLVSIVKHETGSSCNERLVADRPGLEYSVGLGQINVIHHRDCRDGKLKSAGCQAYISMLMDGASNLKVAASIITRNRQFCREKTGHPALFARWLSSYQGYNRRQGVWCNMQRDKKGRWRDVATPSFTKKVMNYRHYLARTLG
jgi:hypothetical protein